MANLLVEEPDALMRARPGLWEPWWVTARATRPAVAKKSRFVRSVRFTSAVCGCTCGDLCVPREQLSSGQIEKHVLALERRKPGSVGDSAGAFQRTAAGRAGVSGVAVVIPSDKGRSAGPYSGLLPRREQPTFADQFSPKCRRDDENNGIFRASMYRLSNLAQYTGEDNLWNANRHYECLYPTVTTYWRTFGR
jgi:hypothetical protein